jgi:hypothetical protein
MQKNMDTSISDQYTADFFLGQGDRKHWRLGIAFGTDDDA